MSLIAAAASAQTFEVATVKPTTPPDYINTRSTSRGGPGTPDPGRWTCDHMSLYSLVLIAYDLRPYQLSGPSWLDSAYFEITAKLPAGTKRDDFRKMLQALLTERFRMEARREVKEVAGYELIVDKGGPKLTESTPPAPGEPEVPPFPTVRPRVTLGADGYPDIPPNMAVIMTMGVRARRRAIRESMDDLAKNLAGQIGKPVVNATGLKGKYDFTISWIYEHPSDTPPPPGDNRPVPPALDTNGPTVFRAIQEQLGLKLQPKKVAVEFLTVERAERTPTEN